MDKYNFARSLVQTPMSSCVYSLQSKSIWCNDVRSGIKDLISLNWTHKRS